MISRNDRLDDVRIEAARPLIPPAILLEELARSPDAACKVLDARADVCNILFGDDPRILAFVGPCSIHDPSAAVAYAVKLQAISKQIESKVFVVMRTYFEKPRTVGGWEGYITDPNLDGSHQINKGLRESRSLLLKLAEMGLPTATEFLDTTVPQFISDLIAWAAIGARTSESQPHRKLASGLSMAVGFKNPVDGRIQPAVDAIQSARRSHWFPGTTKDGVSAHFKTTGNEFTHIVLRGGSKTGPNYSSQHVQEARKALAGAGLPERLVIDCSHGNSLKDHRKQIAVLDDIIQQIRAGEKAIAGVMIESNLVEGKQDPEKSPLTYGQSITDACVSIEDTEQMLLRLADAVS